MCNRPQEAFTPVVFWFAAMYIDSICPPIPLAYQSAALTQFRRAHIAPLSTVITQY